MCIYIYSFVKKKFFCEFTVEGCETWRDRQIIPMCVGLTNSIVDLKMAKVSVSFPQCPKPNSRLPVKYGQKENALFLSYYINQLSKTSEKGNAEKFSGMLTKEW